MLTPMSERQRFLAAVNRTPVDRPALGSVTSLATTEAMAHCGAFFPSVHQDSRLMARLAACASLEAGFDMIFPVFSVVHEAAALGAPIYWGDVDVMPSITAPLWDAPEEITIPDDFEYRPGMAVVLQALSLLRDAYGTRYALVGKTFGPWSLGFHLFGVETILVLSIEDPEKLQRILAGLLEVTVRSCRAQLAAGADVLCVSDHCSREMCAPETYRTFLLPLHQELARRIPAALILHTCGDTADRLAYIAQTGLAGFHYDTRVPTNTARALTAGKMALIGGVSNLLALLPGDPAVIALNVDDALAAGVDVIGPECAVPLNTRMASLRAITTALLARQQSV